MNSRWVLVGIELTTGLAAVTGGVLLAATPDGSLLRADRAVLAGTPFADWRVPGLLLAALVGGGRCSSALSRADDRDRAGRV